MKKAISSLLVFILFLVMFPNGVVAESVNVDIAYSRFFPVDESYYSYMKTANAAVESDNSGAIQAIRIAISTATASVDISAFGISTSQMSEIISKEIYNNPDFFYLNGCSYNYNPSTNTVLNVFFTYLYTYAQIQQMKTDYETAINKALSVIKSGMTDPEKVLAIHDFIILNAKYDYDNYLNGTIPQISYTAYGALVNGICVCNGYALAFQALMARLSIVSIKVVSSTMNHAWNMVYLSGKWYHIDVTWDDPLCPTASGWLNNDYDLDGSVGHIYFLLSDAAITKLSHSGWQPNTNIANSTIYDGDYSNINSGMFWYQGYWYYKNGGNINRSAFNLSNSSIIKTINGYDNTYTFLGVFNNKIYYNYTESSGLKSYIRRINFDGSADKVVLTIDNTGKEISERITELAIQNSMIKYTVYRWPNATPEYDVRYYYYPIPIITGVTDNAIYNTNITITFNRGVAVLDGNAFQSGSIVSEEGQHTITVVDSNSDLYTTVTFTIDKTMPSTPTLSANPTAPTSGNVTVTVTYPADAEVKEYKISTDGTWTAYSVSVVLNANNTVYARCKDAAGNLSEVGSVIVSNIDKIAPSTPTLLANPTAPTSSSVTVTVTFPTDAAVKEYRIGTSAWSAYTVPVVLAANNTVYARCADSAGNLSEVGSIIVSNIDKIAPEKPALFKNPSTLTGGSVTVMITYPPDAAVKEYRIGIGAWIAYTAPVVLSANNTVTARCKDAAGNLSGENSITVDNIDKTPPGIPATPKAVSASYNSVKVTWAAAALATGYVVYRLNPSTGSYVRVKVTKALSYIDGSLTTGKTYTYMVRAYRTVGTVNVYGTPSASFTAKPIPATPANFKAVRYSSTSIKLTWSPVVGASGYVLYRYNASTQAWVRLKVQTATSYINTGLTNDVTYSYKVRAYRMVNSSPIYGNPTAAVSAKTF